jgi:hypothetical protein
VCASAIYIYMLCVVSECGAGEKFSHDIEAGVFFSQLQVCAVFKSGHCFTPVPTPVVNLEQREVGKFMR